MTRILGISGSLRAASFNTALLRAAQSLVEPGVTLDAATLHGIPLYDGDAEAREGLPVAAAELKERIVASDGVLLVTPEYNNSIPGTLKNTIDWLSRPSKDIARVFKGKPVGLIGATPGMGGTRLAQNAWLPVLRVLGMQLWCGGSLSVSDAGKMFDDSGTLTDAKTRELLTRYMQGFVAFTQQG